ncbi:hypothetical protein JAAARDRAFT_141066 [Jaapia argillacea MUCL 33604]|uniref:BPL/LPL catalytic domain-containing protein n=1 Tax=Jaapia argillacea MUCL 33604 TaxID=933084 RepID=A0A067PJ02_9AGAM|nr:hypothetical protein JAAARDRAFT_141066 [Jaapia argillacea MUCL 33604]
MNVLVYSGPEVIQTSLSATISTLRSLLLSNYTVQSITTQSLANHPWPATCSLVVFPACRGPFSSYPALKAVKSYLEQGGSFLALSSGVATSRTGLQAFNSDIGEDQHLRFIDRPAGFAFNPTFQSKSDIGIRPVSTVPDGTETTVYCEGGGDIEIAEEVKGLHILAKYVEGGIAGIIFTLSTGGRAAFWSPSLEYPLTTEPASLVIEKASPSLSAQEIKDAERSRLASLRDTLGRLGLEVPQQTTTFSHPIPQFLVGNPKKPSIINNVLELLKIRLSDDNKDSAVFEDSNDTFRFHSDDESAGLMDVARSSHLYDFEGIATANWRPKHVIAFSQGSLPSPDQTPHFDINRYFDALSTARDLEGCAVGELNGIGFGEALFYGELVTSTQTLLDKNPRFLSTLPSGIVSIASQQLSGRGRGNNIWLSPLGCLQFSIVLRSSLSIIPASKLVFIQYLFCLAVTEACRELGPWGEAVRIKWPNDLYASVGGEMKKIGGILVNTSFGSGKVDIVIGCGLNVLNPPPITSLAQLIPGREFELSLERTVATILAKFEKQWSIWQEAKGSFEPFMDLYFDRWLHS